MRLLKALLGVGHVAYMGDGENDLPAWREADVKILARHGLNRGLHVPEAMPMRYEDLPHYLEEMMKNISRSIHSLVYIGGAVEHGDGRVAARLLVDSGVRGLDAERLGGSGAEAYGRDGARVGRRHSEKEGVSEAVLELAGYGERRTPVVPGESEDLLGAATLEIFGPVLDPSGGSCGPLGR
ncbi:MAG: hypothetical protein RXO30_08960 [Thermoproteus sp.]